VLSVLCLCRTEPSQILIHTRMLENTAQAQVKNACLPGQRPGSVILQWPHHQRHCAKLYQAEALGILGVNLIHSALTKGGDHYTIVSSLMDDLSRARVEVLLTLQ
jgi:hypothetical protein